MQAHVHPSSSQGLCMGTAFLYTQLCMHWSLEEGCSVLLLFVYIQIFVIKTIS